MKPRTLNLLIAFGLFSFVVAFGTVDDWFGATVYGADGIAYIDNANAIRHGDWSLALNPYWSMGYPLVLAAMRWLFPLDWAGEWLAIHVVNLIIFVAAYASFLGLLRQAEKYAAHVAGTENLWMPNTGLFIAGSLIFLEWEVQIKLVAEMSPDLWVSGLFFLLTALSLNFCRKQTVTSALLMGMVAGLGYIVKAAFLPISLFIFLAVCLRILTRQDANRFLSIRKFAWVLPAMALVAVPYVIALSVNQDRFTFGESGGLNYAWTVNKLTHWHWTGGPPEFGTPIHGVHLLSASPHVYEYAEPLHVTYPPFYNAYYWYEGYHHFFNLHNQIAAIKANLFTLTTLFFNTPHAPLKALGALALVVAAVLLFPNRVPLGRRLLVLWPLYVPSLLGIALYVAVFVEARYVVGFIIVLLVVPLVTVLVPKPLVNRRDEWGILIAISVLSLTHLIHDARPTLRRAWHNEPYINAQDWRINFYLTAHGVAPGTKVAMVKVERGIQTTWAFVSGLRVIGQIGDQDLTKAEQEQDFQLFLNHPDVQQNILQLFRQSGADLVVAFDVPSAPQGEGWTSIPTTKAWVHWLK